MNDYSAATDRPTGVTLLAILHFLGGLATATILSVIAYARTDPDIKERLAALDLQLLPLVGAMVFLAVLGIGSAIGMWWGARLGWYLGSFLYMYLGTRCLLAITSVICMLAIASPNEWPATPEELGRYCGYASIYFLIYILIYVYFFKSNVRAYFGLTESVKWKTVATEFTVCIAIMLLVRAWSLLASWATS